MVERRKDWYSAGRNLIEGWKRGFSAGRKWSYSSVRRWIFAEEEARGLKTIRHGQSHCNIERAKGEEDTFDDVTEVT